MVQVACGLHLAMALAQRMMDIVALASLSHLPDRLVGLAVLLAAPCLEGLFIKIMVWLPLRSTWRERLADVLSFAVLTAIIWLDDALGCMLAAPPPPRRLCGDLPVRGR